MWRRVGEPEEERVRRRRLGGDHVECLLGQHVGLVVGRRAAVAHRGAVLVQLVVVGIGVRLQRRVPLRPAVRDLGRISFELAVLVHVLADQRGVIAGALQRGREVRVAVIGVELVEAAVGELVRGHVVVVRVEPGEEGGSRGTAERQVDVAVGEARSLTAAEQGSRLVHRLHRLGRLVVGHDDDDVRWLDRPARPRRCRRRPRRWRSARASRPINSRRIAQVLVATMPGNDGSASLFRVRGGKGHSRRADRALGTRCDY